MAVIVTEPLSEREEIEMLLPWHAAGTLSPADARRVKRAIDADPELGRQFELAREELVGAVHVNETLGVPSGRMLERLLSQIDVETARQHQIAPIGLFERFSTWLASAKPRSLAYVSVATGAIIFLQAAVITAMVMSQGERGGYMAASAPATNPGSFAMVQFVPQTSAAEISAFLKNNKLAIVDGPNADGLFKVRIAAQALPKQALAEAVWRWRQDKVVGFFALVE
jgi:hypothetical protein